SAERKIRTQAGSADFGPSHRFQIAGSHTEDFAAFTQLLDQFMNGRAQLRAKLIGVGYDFSLQKFESTRQQWCKASRFTGAGDGGAQNADIGIAVDGEAIKCRLQAINFSQHAAESPVMHRIAAIE